MRKRKKPVVLTTILVLMVGGIGIANFPKELLGKASAPAPGTPETGQEIQVPDKNDIAKDVSKSISGTAKPGGGAPMNPMEAKAHALGEDSENSGTPSIALTKPAPYKPMPNDSSTSTQWYTSATPKSIPKPRK